MISFGFGRQQGLGELFCQLKQRGRMGVDALAQGRARSYCDNLQSVVKEVITSKFFNCIEVVFDLRQQAQVGRQNVVIGYTASKPTLIYAHPQH